MAATISLTTTFNLTTGFFNFTDTSNYAAQGSPDTGVMGCLKITGPSGIVYQNAAFATPVSATADITTAGGFVNNSIAIPLDANGDIQRGDYTIEYKVYVTGGTDAGQTFTLTPADIDYTFVSPEVDITQSVDCINAIFTSTDNTDYDEEGVTPSITRTHTVTEVANPSRTNLSNTNAANTVVYPNLYVGNYRSTISTIASYAFSNFTVSVTLTGNSTYEVTCTSPGDVFEGMQDVEAAYLASKANGDIKAAADNKDKLELLLSYYKLYEMAINFQDTTSANTYLATIKSLGNFTSSCSSTTGQVIPVQVKGDVFKTTSSTSLAIGSGTKTWSVIAGLSYSTGTSMRGTDAANPANYMEGPVSSYSGTNISIVVAASGGTGTISNWIINVGS